MRGTKLSRQLVPIPLAKVCFKVGESHSVDQICNRLPDITLFVQECVGGTPGKALNEG